MGELVVTTEGDSPAQFLDTTTSVESGDQYLDFIIPPGTIQDAIVEQVAHGLSVENVVRFNGTIFVLAKADTPEHAEVAGIVIAVPSPDIFYLHCIGPMEFGSLIPGSVYFLSNTTAGLLTADEPSDVGDISKPLLIACGPTTGYFFNFRGMVNEGAVDLSTIPGQIDPSTQLPPLGANPAVNVTLSVQNGSPTTITYIRSDAAPALSQAIVPSWTGFHTFKGGIGLGANSTPPPLTGDLNDYALASGAITILRLDAGGADRNFTGIAGGGVNGRILWITNIGATNNITLRTLNSGSLAANQFDLPNDVVLTPHGGIVLLYDAQPGALKWKAFGRAVANTGVTPGTYDPAAITVGSDGRIISASSSAGSGVPTSRTLTINGTAFDLSANRLWIVGDALVANPLSQFAPTTSAQLAGIISDKTGSGPAVFGTSPNIITPTGIVRGDVGLGNVTNDAQIKASNFPASSVDSEVALFNGTAGNSLKRSALTGIVKLTSGVQGAALPGDFPILNQNTTGSAGSAATLTTPRNINQVAFDGSANIVTPAIGAAGTELRSDGTNWNASPFTLALPGSAMNRLFSDGTNWVALRNYAPIALPSATVSILTAGTPADVTTITIPPWITRWTFVNSAGNLCIFANTAAGTMAAGVVQFRTAATGGGVALNSTALAPPVTANSFTNSGGTATTSTFTVSTIFVNQTVNSANAGTVTFYVAIIPIGF
jgi:hypothetical protein